MKDQYDAKQVPLTLFNAYISTFLSDKELFKQQRIYQLL